MVLSSSVACQPHKPVVFIDEETEVAPTPLFLWENWDLNQATQLWSLSTEPPS